MNESELETTLRNLTPRAPSNALEERIARELNGALVPVENSGWMEHRRPRALAPLARQTWWERLWPSCAWTLAGAAAGVAVMLAWPQTPGGTVAQQPPMPLPPATVASIFEPVTAEAEVVATEEDDIVYDESNAPTQVVRYSSLERHLWTNPATGAQLEVVMPRQDITLVNASYQ